MTDELARIAQMKADELEAAVFVPSGSSHRGAHIATLLRAHHAAERAKAFILRNDPTGACVGHNRIIAALDALMLTPPADPFADAVSAAADGLLTNEQLTDRLRTELAKRGLEIREGGGA